MNSLPLALLLAALLLPAWLFLRDNRGRLKQRLQQVPRLGWVILFFAYLGLTLATALFTRPVTNPYREIWSHFGFRRSARWNNEIIENILFFVPYTCLYLQAFRPERPVRQWTRRPP